MAFSSFYGFFTGGYVSLYPVGRYKLSKLLPRIDGSYIVAADLYGVEGLASITGVMFSSFVVSNKWHLDIHGRSLMFRKPGTLVGPPVSGAILDRHTDPSTGKINFLPVQLFGGTWLIASALMAVMVKVFYDKGGNIAI